MRKMVFKIRLKQEHDKRGVTAYVVAKETGLSHNTVMKYVARDAVLSASVPMPVVVLADFYGVDWRDPAIVQVVEVEESAVPAAS